MLSAITSLALAAAFVAGDPSSALVERASMTPSAIVRSDSARSDAEVRASVLRNTSDIRRCYESEGLPRNPSLSGTMDIALTILPTGVVSDVRVDSLALRGPGSAEVARCIVRHARNWRFERGDYATETHLFPLSFVTEMAKPILGGKRGA